ncbi:hypothetical protein [Winogradskyella aquimaris]|uniref:Uncharacterized protein n=1 Tax=Winogradskyella aquimaris TaxID=864074 RepID=A0ABU5EQ59_9FLAO|nr:hypothetical protein [Winogradskyella aquimaris]MDY2588202.1 hypothetical protein [Winogradskyella aquimaris]
MKDKKDSLKSNYSRHMDLDEAIEIVTMLINNINPINNKPYDDLGVCLNETVKEALKSLIDIRISTKSKKSYYKKQKNSKPVRKYIQRSLNKINLDNKDQSKFLSATSLGKLKNKTYTEVISIMRKNELILNADEITFKGQERGLKFKQNSSGIKWIVYPESLSELL